jgi:hypothetical protein
MTSIVEMEHRSLPLEAEAPACAGHPAPLSSRSLIFTVDEIASALGRVKRTLNYALEGVPNTGWKYPRGRSAPAWAFSALPIPLQTKIEYEAKQRNFKNPEDLLSQFAMKPTESISSLTKQNKASPSTNAHVHDWLMDEIEQFRRTLAENGIENFDRDDQERVWRLACEHFTKLIEVAPKSDHSALKSSLIDLLLDVVPELVEKYARKKRKALKRNLERKLKALKKEGRQGLRDGRTLKSGYKRAILCSECWTKVLAVATKNGGNESLAWRQLKKGKELCLTCDSHHELDLDHHKSHVPTTIRKKATPLADAAQKWIQSEAAGRAAGPHIVRNYDGQLAGDYFMFDDVKWNINAWWLSPDGTSDFGRVNCLYAADELTGYVVAFYLLVRPHNGLDIATIKLRSHDRAGLPHFAWKFENGLWRCRMADPENSPEFQRLVMDGESWIQDAFGLNCTNFSRPRVKHYLPRNPKAKNAEGDFGIHQRLQMIWPGNVGSNERETKSDADKDFEKQVRNGNAHPGEKYLSLDECNVKLSKQIDDFHEEKRGGRIKGFSPMSRWLQDTERKELRTLQPNERWLISTHMTEKKVTPRGITLTIAGKLWNYAGPELRRFFGERVLVFSHIETPSLITVCDLKRKTFAHAEGTELPANGASKDQLRSVNQRIAAFNSLPKMVADLIHHPVIKKLADVPLTGPVSQEFGREMANGKAAHEKKLRVDSEQKSAVQKEALKKLHEAMAAAAKEENQ